MFGMAGNKSLNAQDCRAGALTRYHTCQAEDPVEPGVPEAAPVALHSNLHSFLVVASVLDS